MKYWYTFFILKNNNNNLSVHIGKHERLCWYAYWLILLANPYIGPALIFNSLFFQKICYILYLTNLTCPSL